MTKTITTIFTDLGGVLLTNGWSRTSRAEAIQFFDLDAEDTEERHHLTFDTYEVGKITLDEYLNRVIFLKTVGLLRMISGNLCTADRSLMMI